MFQSPVPSLWVSFTFWSDLSVAQPVPPGKNRSHVFYAMQDDLKKDANFLLILPRESGIIKVVQTDAPVCRNGRRGGLKIRFVIFLVCTRNSRLCVEFWRFVEAGFLTSLLNIPPIFRNRYECLIIEYQPMWRNGRRKRLKIVRETMWVRVPPSALHHKTA